MDEGPTRIQLCGRLVIELRGRRLDQDLPGGKERLLFTYLVLNRTRPVPRRELIDALWPQGPPPAAGLAKSFGGALKTKLAGFDR